MGVVLACVGLVGCADQGDTCGVDSNAISVEVVWTDNGRNLRAAVDFEIGDRTVAASSASICESDRLELNGQSPRPLIRGERTEYTLIEQADASRSLTVRWERDTGDLIAAAIELPESFTVLEPTVGATSIRGQPIPLSWSPDQPDDEMLIVLREEIGAGICLRTPIEGQNYKGEGVWVADSGAWTVPGDAIVTEKNAPPCRGRWSLLRAQIGAYPDNLGPGGYVLGTTVRVVPFLSATQAVAQ